VLPFNQIYAMILDGLSTHPTPAFLWVSRDAGKLEDSVRLVAVKIVEGSAPEVLQGRRLLHMQATALLTALSSSDLPPVDQMEVLIRELESSGAALALERPELLCDSGLPFDACAALCDALAAGRIGCFIGLTSPEGADRLRSIQPRLLMLTGVSDLDTKSSHGYRTVVLHTSDQDELGWLVAVRSRLLAPVEALSKYGSGPSGNPAEPAAELKELGIDKCWIVAEGDNLDGIVISIREEAAAMDDESTAETVALTGTRRLIQRAIKEGEALEVTRMIYLAAGPEAA
jgi:hypothetical protein